MKKPSRLTLAQFLKAQLSSLGATCVDLLVTALLFRLAGFSPFWSTLLGAVCGGIVNCITNYRWTFRGTDRSRRGVAIRYLVVWGGSILLNAWGVKAAVAILPSHPAVTLTQLMVIRIIIAVLVAILWNFNLQKRWVYRLGTKEVESEKTEIDG